MKRTHFLVMVALLGLAMNGCGGGSSTPASSSSPWAWMSGADTCGASGTYGSLDTADAANVPGARFGAITWTDASGNLWLFGGNGYDSAGSSGNLNDLWKYDTSNGEWTWVSGLNSTGDYGTYGTKGTPDSSNVPGARELAVSWTDASGNLWLFGGYGNAYAGTGNLNDLWKYDTSTGKWTWVSGSNSADNPGVYGTQGTADSGNVPGAREDAVSWTDASGNLWLFGGYGVDATGTTKGDLNDLWEFDTSTSEWIWVSGSNVRSASGTYGTKGTADSGNVPGARESAVSWTDASGNLWLFGGMSPSWASFNDLWEYNTSTDEWTWMGGPDTVDGSGVYGTQGTAATTNVPGARYNAVSWTDASGNLWLSGGEGYDSAGSTGRLNDLWTFHP